jgi:hypothetical protein
MSKPPVPPLGAGPMFLAVTSVKASGSVARACRCWADWGEIAINQAREPQRAALTREPLGLTTDAKGSMNYGIVIKR